MMHTSVAAALARALVGQSASGGFWFPDQAARQAAGVDWLFHFILYVATIFFVLIIVIMAYFAVKYRKKRGSVAEKTPGHNTPLELAWSIIPGLLLIPMFYFGVVGYMDLRTPPDDAYEVQVTARKWSWSFTYPNGYTDPNLHVPVDQPVRLVMTSEDVIHSFFVPAFRTKMDVVPGRYTKIWFNATEVGEHQIFCTEYCGTKHSEMLAKVIVHGPGEFEHWLEGAGDILKGRSPAEAGKILVKNNGCLACHSTDGKRGIGPSWKGIFGKDESLATGATVNVDENYIRESILDPQSKVVGGFAPVMPTFKGRLKDDELTAIIEYIKTLK